MSNYMSSLLSYSSEVIFNDLKAHQDNILESVYFKELAVALDVLRIKAEIAGIKIPYQDMWIAKKPFHSILVWNQGTWADIKPMVNTIQKLIDCKNTEVKKAAWRVQTLLHILLSLTYDLK